MEWNSALSSFIYVHLPLRPVTMSHKDLRYSTCRLYSQVSSVVRRLFCLSVSLLKDHLFFKIAETIIMMLIGLICEISPNILGSLPLLFYILFSTLLGAAMKPCPTRTRATASCIRCLGFCFFYRWFSSEKVFARFFFYAYTSSLSSCLCIQTCTEPTPTGDTCWVYIKPIMIWTSILHGKQWVFLQVLWKTSYRSSEKSEGRLVLC